jgi:glyoxylase-like metal-dependent hydrolase (beta-lactamase superfamily II)
MSAFTLPIPQPGSSAEATVTVELLRCGEGLAPPGWFYRREANGSWRRALGVGVPREELLRSPNGAFLVHHPSFGPFLIDTALSSQAATDLRRDFGAINARFFSSLKMRPEEAPAAQVRRLGIAPEDIELVVMTHLHVDHTSGMREFPKARFLCTDTELGATRARFAVLSGYVRKQLPPAERLTTFSFSQGHAYGPFSRTVDLFDDGSVRLISTPGHSAGHMSVLVRLTGGEALLLGDAAYTMRSIHESLISWRTADDELFFSSLREIQDWIKDNPGAPVIPTHDAGVWDQLRQLR